MALTGQADVGSSKLLRKTKGVSLLYRIRSTLARGVVNQVPFIFFTLRLHVVWRFVPIRFRQIIVGWVLGYSDQTVRVGGLTEKGPYTLCGVPSGGTSFGWVLKHLESKFKGDGERVTTIDVSAHFGSGRNHGLTHQYREQLSFSPGTLVIVLNPPQLRLALSLLPRPLVENSYLIACVAWELEELPQSWLDTLSIVDEVWVCSSFVAKAFERAQFTKPVKVVRPELDRPKQLNCARRQFGIVKDRFTFLTSLNLRSGLVRKNLDAAIDAFVEAFGHQPEGRGPILVIKLHDSRLHSAEQTRIRNMISKHNNIHLVDADISDQENWDLIASCDAIFSMHRSEGFGLTLYQGLVLGKEVIATGWSGNLDFMTPQNSHLVPYKLVPVRDPAGTYKDFPEQVWAEPCVKSAAKLLTQIYVCNSKRDVDAVPKLSA